jgi:Transposase DDE domain
MKPHKFILQWNKEVRKAFAHLSKPQAHLLAAFSLGAAWAKSCTLSRIAQSLFALGSLPAVERRCQRFLSNAQVDWQAGSAALARWVLSRALPKRGKPLVLLVDETSLHEHLKVMVVALAYRGRAIPLAWWCYSQYEYPLPQVELIDTLFEQIAPALPPGVPVLVQADRGIGCSPDLIAAVERRHWHYLFRVQRSVELVLEDGRRVGFGNLVPRPGRCCWPQPVRAFKKAGGVACHALGYWKVGRKEPWLLLTNWPAATTTKYGLRMWEEAAFRDLKSNGFNWQSSRVRQPDHANRLWLILALAYAWMVSLGTLVQERESLRHQVAHGDRERVSVFRLGLRWLDRCLQRRRKLNFEPRLDPEGLS